MTATSLHLLILLVLVHFFFLFSQLDDIIHLFTTLNTSWRSDFFFFFFISRYWNQLTLFVTRLMFKASRFI